MSTPPDSTLSVRDLAVHYGPHAALRDVSLDLPSGEITAIVGPSGCGKSTFLSCFNRLIDLQPGARIAGRIHFRGRDILEPSEDLLALRRRIGMVFQRANPFPLSIRRNFELPLREHGVPRAEFGGIMEASLREVGLWEEVRERLDTPARNLSGGQQQRLCIARTLALNPEVILFDEPCSALDPLSSGVVEECIAKLRGRLTVLIVTHNLAQARRLAQRVAVFWLREGAGTIVDQGEAPAIFDDPSDADARRYLTGACC